MAAHCTDTMAGRDRNGDHLTPECSGGPGDQNGLSHADDVNAAARRRQPRCADIRTASRRPRSCRGTSRRYARRETAEMHPFRQRHRHPGGTLPVVPKKSVSGQAALGGEISTRPIGTWVAAGMALAVIGSATRLGWFTVLAAILLAPMVYVFARLRGHAPRARTTSDLVGAVLGDRVGVFVGLIQLLAYLLLATKFALLAASSLWAGALLVVADPNIPSSGVVGGMGAAASVDVGVLLPRACPCRADRNPN